MSRDLRRYWCDVQLRIVSDQQLSCLEWHDSILSKAKDPSRDRFSGTYTDARHFTGLHRAVLAVHARGNEDRSGDVQSTVTKVLVSFHRWTSQRDLSTSDCRLMSTIRIFFNVKSSRPRSRTTNETMSTQWKWVRDTSLCYRRISVKFHCALSTMIRWEIWTSDRAAKVVFHFICHRSCTNVASSPRNRLPRRHNYRRFATVRSTRSRETFKSKMFPS